MTFAALAPLAGRASLFTALRQDALARAVGELGEHRWDVDLDAASLTFTSNADHERRLAVGAHLIATIAPGPRTLLWAWARPQGDPHGLSTRLRDYGTQYGIAELAQGEVAIPADAGDDLDGWITGAAEQIGTVGVEVTGASPYFSAPVAGGTRAIFLLEAPFPAPTVADAVAALPRLLAELALDDPRSAVWDAARLAGWDLQWTDEAFGGAVVRDASGSATFTFDEHARITGIDSSLGG